MHVFGLTMASIATKYYQLLLAQGICSAIGAAAIFQPGKHPLGLYKTSSLTENSTQQCQRLVR
jgi:hypothetical protein